MKYILFTTLLVISFCQFALADTIVGQADPWCPYNCKPGSDKPGYVIEAATKIFKEAGHKFVYTSTPWSRVVAGVKDGSIQAGVSAAKADIVGAVYPVVEQGKIRNAFFTKKGSTWKYTGVESLKKVKVGLIKDYDYGEAINKYKKGKGSTAQIIGGETALTKNIKKLLAGRVDVVIENSNVFLNTAKTMGVLDETKMAGSDDPDLLYIAFTSKDPKSKKYAKILSDGWAKLRKSGELSKILTKYGLKDWK